MGSVTGLTVWSRSPNAVAARIYRWPFCRGDDKEDPDLPPLSTLPKDITYRLWQYLVQGGARNYENFLNFAASLIVSDIDWREPSPLPKAGLYWLGLDTPDFASLQPHWISGAPVIAITFYRALYQANNLTPVDDLIAALQHRGLNPLPLFISSLKDPISKEIVSDLFEDAAPRCHFERNPASLSPTRGASVS